MKTAKQSRKPGPERVIYRGIELEKIDSQAVEVRGEYWETYQRQGI